MFWIHPKKDQQAEGSEQDQLKKLKQALREVGHVQLSVKERSALKRQIMTRLEQSQSGQTQIDFLPSSLKVLGAKIQEAGAKTNLSTAQQLKMKDRIMFYIRQTDWMGKAVAPFKNVRFWRTAISSALLLFFVATTVLLFPLQVPLTYAARLTYIDQVSGQVYVLRDSKLIPAQKNFTLQEGDIIITKDNSFASIRFFDDSQSRLDSNTQLEVKRLYSEPFNPVATQVEVLLQDGHLWTRVLNLIDENSHFMVSTDRSVAIVSNKAAFDLQTQPTNTTLSVFDNVVDFGLGQDTTNTQPVVAGFQAQVSQQLNGANVAKIVPINENSASNKSNASWVASNLAQDQSNTANVIAQNQQALTTAQPTDNSSNPDSADSTSDSKALSNPVIEQARLNFLDGYNRLITGETDLIRQQSRTGMQLILEFENIVRGIMVHYPDYQKQDPLNAGLLYSFMQAKIEGQRKDLATFLPGDTLYPAKEELDNTELFLAASDVDKLKMQLSQSEDKLLEAQGLIQNGKFDVAKDLLTRYERQIDSLVLVVNSDDSFELHDKLVSLFDQQIEQIKVLTALEESLYSDSTQTALVQQIEDLRQKLVQNLTTAFEKFNDTLPVSLVQELRDLLQTYKDNGAYDHEFINLLNNMIMKYDRSQDSGTNTQVITSLPSQLGVVTVVEELDATPPVDAQTQQASDTQQTTFTQQADSSLTQQSDLTQQVIDNCDIVAGC